MSAPVEPARSSTAAQASSPKLSPWSYLGRYKLRIAAGVLLLLATNVAVLTIPWLLGRAIDAMRMGSPDLVTPLAILMVCFAIAQALIRIGSRLALFNTAREAEYDLRADLFAHLLRLEPGFYRQHPTGDVMSRLTSDVQTVRVMWGPGILNVVNTAAIFSMALFLMIRIDPVLTLWALLPYPCIVLIGGYWGRRIHRASRDVQEQLGTLSSSIQEDLTGIGVIKTYTLEGARQENFARQSERLLSRNMVLVKIRGLLLPLLGGLASIGTIVVIYVGGRAVIQGRIELGQLIQFNGYLAALIWPTMALGWMISLFQRGIASWDRLAELLRSQPQIVDGTGADPDPATLSGRLEVRDLTVEIDGRRLLDRVSFEVPAGSVCAVVGRTGSGKSTLVEALPRIIDVPKGTVFLDGHDITQMPLGTLRNAIGYAPQDAFLFSTTIERNIALGYERGGDRAHAERDDARLRSAVEAAGLTRDLAALPAGVDTVVGERGITLSGGQRQRVALARALATAPRLLVLDDSLSSVDAETESEILGHLGEVMQGRTAILISHRVAAVKRADQIVVLDEGRVVERGTHDELLASGGVYAQLYHSQLAESPGAAAAAESQRAGA